MVTWYSRIASSLLSLLKSLLAVLNSFAKPFSSLFHFFFLRRMEIIPVSTASMLNISSIDNIRQTNSTCLQNYFDFITMRKAKRVNSTMTDLYVSFDTNNCSFFLRQRVGKSDSYGIEISIKDENRKWQRLNRIKNYCILGNISLHLFIFIISFTF